MSKVAFIFLNSDGIVYFFQAKSSNMLHLNENSIRSKVWLIIMAVKN